MKCENSSAKELLRDAKKRNSLNYKSNRNIHNRNIHKNNIHIKKNVPKECSLPNIIISGIFSAHLA